MPILKDFVRLIFGLPEDEPVSNAQAAMVICVIVFICFMLSIAL